MFHIASAALWRSLTRQRWFSSYAWWSSSSHSLSIRRRKKEIGKEGLIAAKELKRLQSNPVRLDRFIKSHVSWPLKSDLVAAAGPGFPVHEDCWSEALNSSLSGTRGLTVFPLLGGAAFAFTRRNRYDDSLL